MVMGLEIISDTTLTELTLLLLAFVLSALIGIERSRKLKSAGLRTHTLVGLGSALFTLVSAYGFQGMLGPDVQLDPSRIAAQIVSGIGFLGAGVIFVKNDAVNGLTTAASVWMTAAVGMACGAGMPILAIAGTALQLVSVTFLTVLGRRVQKNILAEPHIEIRYRYSKVVLTSVLEEIARAGYGVSLVKTDSDKGESAQSVLHIRGLMGNNSAKIDELLSALAAIRGVRLATRMEPEEDD